MKELLFDIIAKIKDYTNSFIDKSKKNFELEESKNEIIKIMMDSIIEKRRNEKNSLLSELSTKIEEKIEINKKIDSLKEENELYKERIDMLTSFQNFLINNQQI